MKVRRSLLISGIISVSIFVVFALLTGWVNAGAG